MKEYSQLSDQELASLAEKIQQEQALRDTEKQRKEDLKRTYILHSPKKEYEFLPNKFYHEVMELGKNNPSLMEKLKNIEANCQMEKSIPKEAIYPCPECGTMMLRSGNFGDTFDPKYKILCDNCDFVVPDRGCYSASQAWDKFQRWLIREGYLPSNHK